MKNEDLPVPFLGVMERLREKTLQQALLRPGVFCSPNMSPFVLVGKPTIEDSVAINLAAKLPFEKTVQLRRKTEVTSLGSRQLIINTQYLEICISSH